MLERDVEAALVAAVKAAGGLAMKFTSPQRRSVPDRLVLMPGCAPVFVECKAPGKKPTDAQAREHARIWAAGGAVRIIDSIEGVRHFVGGL